MPTFAIFLTLRKRVSLYTHVNVIMQRASLTIICILYAPDTRYLYKALRTHPFIMPLGQPGLRFVAYYAVVVIFLDILVPFYKSRRVCSPNDRTSVNRFRVFCVSRFWNCRNSSNSSSSELLRDLICWTQNKSIYSFTRPVNPHTALLVNALLLIPRTVTRKAPWL